MVPSVADVVRYRYFTAALLRLTGLVFALIGMAPMASWLAEGLRDSDLGAFYYYWPRIIAGVVLTGGGVGLLLFAPLLARIALRIRSSSDIRCPRCGYGLQPTLMSRERPVCTECGLILPAELLTPTEAAHQLRAGDSTTGQ